MIKNKTVISIVHTTFQNDNRVLRIAQSIAECGFDVTIVAWCKNQIARNETVQGIAVERLNPPFNGLKRSNKIIGLLQFLSFSLNAVITYRKKHIWHCNDLEGLFIGLLAKLTRPKLILIYDSHELQSGRLGLSATMQRLIRFIEWIAIPLTHSMISVSPGIVNYYQKRHKKAVHLIRNIPERMVFEKEDYFRSKFNIPKASKIFLYQGGLVPGRGIELLIETFISRKNQDAVLMIMGDGKLEKYVTQEKEKTSNIYYHPAVPFYEIAKCTSSADVGFNMAQNNCLNHHYCLPNKLFEYIQCELPVISNNLEDCANLIHQYRIGVIIQEYSINGVNKAIDQFLKSDFHQLLENTKKAKGELEWEKEKTKLVSLYKELL